MSAPRARANHSLYLAKILLGNWRAALEAQDIPSRTLCEAFLEATCNHLRDAYGWFLLEISQLDNAATVPPGSVAELPPIPEGRAEAGELRECRQLEESGWLAQLLGQGGVDVGAKVKANSAVGNLAAPAVDAPEFPDVMDWHTELGALFERMRDSLDEY